MPRGMGDVQPRLSPDYVPVKRVGIRLFHDNLRSCTIVVIHPTRRYKVPYQCPTCNKIHERKAIHLNLDTQGSVIVSAGVFKRLQESGMPSLTVANEVQNPPSQTLFIGHTPKVFEVEEMDMGTSVGKIKVLRKKLWRRNG